jgi:endo-beta-N-acetylglucosaminidase D
MIPDGRVRWQNELNEHNLPYLQHGKVGAVGSERRADAIFLNYWWNGAMLRQSRQRAEQLGLSRYQLYVGVDLWPERDAQQAFVQTRWLHDWFDASRGEAHSSLALFAPNVNFNYAGHGQQPPYSRFSSDGADVQRFYATEQRLFVGDDGNLARADKHWPGIASVLPAKTVLTSLPFKTHFNTGQGRFWFTDGQLSRPPFAGVAATAAQLFSQGWTDISQQDILPTWQFALEAAPVVQQRSIVQYDFNRAWQGGSSLWLQMPKPADANLPLYQFALSLPTATRLTVRYQTAAGGFALAVKTDQQQLLLPLPAGRPDDWQLAQLDLSALTGQQLQRLTIVASVTDTASVTDPAGITKTAGAAAPVSLRLGALQLSSSTGANTPEAQP